MLFAVVESLSFSFECCTLLKDISLSKRVKRRSETYLLVIPPLYITFLFFEFTNLVTQLLRHFDASGHLFFHAALVCIQFRQASFGRVKRRSETVILGLQRCYRLFLILQLDQQLEREVRNCAHSTLRPRKARTCSFFSVSCLRDCDSDSRVSPLMMGGGVVVPFRDGRRAGVLREADTRGDTAERAVAPL